MLFKQGGSEGSLADDRWSKLAPLTGVLFAVLTVVAVITGGEAPNADARPGSGSRYSTHASEVETSSILIALAFLALVLFGGALVLYLRRAPGAEGPLRARAGRHGARWPSARSRPRGSNTRSPTKSAHSGLEVAQTLNVLSNELFLPRRARSGSAPASRSCAARHCRKLGLGHHRAGRRHASADRIIRPVSFVLWVIVVSILMYQRTGLRPALGEAPPVSRAAGAVAAPRADPGGRARRGFAAFRHALAARWSRHPRCG